MLMHRMKFRVALTLITHENHPLMKNTNYSKYVLEGELSNLNAPIFDLEFPKLGGCKI